MLLLLVVVVVVLLLLLLVLLVLLVVVLLLLLWMCGGTPSQLPVPPCPPGRRGWTAEVSARPTQGALPRAARAGAGALPARPMAEPGGDFPARPGPAER